jgi:hypothetical protein
MNRTLLGIVILVMGLAQIGVAQKKVLTAAYLRASMGAITDRTSVAIRAEYLVDPGMVEAIGRGLRNKGYSRFSIRDPKTGAVFNSMYCKQESDVFWQLLKSESNTLLMFRGEKSRGEDREDAIIVDRLDRILLAPKEIADRVAGVKPVEPTLLRVTLTDEETGIRTVLPGVERGKPVSIDGITITIEDQPAPGR